MNLLYVLLLLIGTSSLFAEEASVAEVLRVIEKSHPEIQAARSQSAAARKKADGAAIVYPDPEIMYMRGSGSMSDSAFYPSIDVQKDRIQEREVRLTQEIPFPGKLTMEARGMHARADSLDAKLALEINRVNSAYLLARAQFLKLKKDIVLLSEYETSLIALEALVWQNYRQGRGLLVETRLVTAERLSTTEMLQGLKGERATIARDLDYYSSLTIPDQAFEAYMLQLSDRLRSKTTEVEQIESLPRILLAQAEVERAGAEGKRAYFNYAPNFNVFGGYKTRRIDGNYTTIAQAKENIGVIGVTIRVPVWSFFANRSTTDAFEQEQKAELFSKAALISKIRNRIRGLKERIEITNQRLHAHTHQISPVSLEGSDAALNAYRSGRVSMETVIGALERNVRHRLDETAVAFELHALLIEAGAELNMLSSKKGEDP